MVRGKRISVMVYVVVVICFIEILTGCSKQSVQTLSEQKAPATEREMTARKQTAAEKTDVQPVRDKSQPSDQAIMERCASAADGKTKRTGLAADRQTLRSNYVVREGDSLWWIAKYRDIYNDPYLWPILYEANKNVIKDPHKIYPGMKLRIPRTGYKTADLQNARKTAGASRPYNPPARAVPPAD